MIAFYRKTAEDLLGNSQLIGRNLSQIKCYENSEIHKLLKTMIGNSGAMDKVGHKGQTEVFHTRW